MKVCMDMFEYMYIYSFNDDCFLLFIYLTSSEAIFFNSSSSSCIVNLYHKRDSYIITTIR